MMIRCLMFILGGILLTGCAEIQPVHFTGPNGKDAYAMECSDWGRTIEMCYQKAGEVCPNGYTIVGQHSGTDVYSTGSGVFSETERHMAIECK